MSGTEGRNGSFRSSILLSFRAELECADDIRIARSSFVYSANDISLVRVCVCVCIHFPRFTRKVFPERYDSEDVRLGERFGNSVRKYRHRIPLLPRHNDRNYSENYFNRQLSPTRVNIYM